VKPPEDQAAGPPEDSGRPGATATAGEETAAPESVRLEQCPNCAILLTRDERGVRCLLCGFPHEKKRPSRPAELEEYLGRLRRGDRRADAEELIDLAERLALQWGSPELKPAPRRLLTRDDSGPALAVQEASGSERYLVVVLGEAPWPSGLVHFFSIEEEAGAPLVTRVRLREESVATLDGRGNLECQSAGKLQVVARAAAAERAAPPASPPVAAKPPAEIPFPPTAVPPVPRRPVVSGAVVAALFAAVLAILGAVWIARSRGGGGGETPSPTPPGTPSLPTYSPPAVGSLEVRANCPALGNLDGLILPESKKQRSSVLRWTNQPARAHRLKVTCDGFEDYTQNVSLEDGENTVLPVTLRRR
jgi:hypothetical protein